MLKWRKTLRPANIRAVEWFSGCFPGTGHHATSLTPMKNDLLKAAPLITAFLVNGTLTTHAAVNSAGVVMIDAGPAGATSGSILETAGRVDLALNFGSSSAASINGISFNGAVLTGGSPISGAVATLTPNPPTPAGTSLRNLDLNGFLWTTGTPFAGVMNDAVDSQRFPAVSGDALNFTISGLDANRFYFIQLLSGDTRAEFENQNYTLGGVTQNAQFGNGGNNDGALVKFTASGESSLTLSVSNVTGNSPPMLAGILIRSIEPGLFAPPSAGGTSNGVPETLGIEIGNASSIPYSITGVSFTGDHAGDFSNGSSLPLVVPGPGNANLNLNITPTAGGTRTATMLLTTDDPSAAVIEIALSVDVLDPVVLIGPVLDFGSASGLGRVDDIVFVDNDGGATALTLTSPVITGPGASAFDVISLPDPISPGGFDTIVIAFDPSAPGYYEADLELMTNDPFEPTVNVRLRGEVTGDLIQNVLVTSVSTENIFGIDRDANRTIDGSGLTGLGSAGSTHGIGENSLVWTSNGILAAPNDLAPFITYDLGGVYQVTKIREWGYNDPTLNITYNTQAMIFGPDAVDIFTSTDNVVFTPAGTVHFALAPGTPGYTGNEIPVSLPAARYLRFEIKSNHAGAVFDGSGATPGIADPRGLTGLSEIRFEGTAVTSSPFELWLDSEGLTGPDRAPDADPDRDGSSNLIEYLTGGDPEVSDPEKLPQSEMAGGNLTVSFDRPDDVAGVIIRFEVSTDLQLWPDIYTVGTSPEITVTPNGSAPDTITLAIPITGEPRRFARLSAELDP